MEKTRMQRTWEYYKNKIKGLSNKEIRIMYKHVDMIFLKRSINKIKNDETLCNEKRKEYLQNMKTCLKFKKKNFYEVIKDTELKERIQGLSKNIFHEPFSKYPRKIKLDILKVEILRLQKQLCSLRWKRDYFKAHFENYGFDGYDNKEIIHFLKLNDLIISRELLLSAYKMERRRIKIKYTEKEVNIFKDKLKNNYVKEIFPSYELTIK